VRVYAGATFARYEEVREINAALRAGGHVVTHDWTLTDEFGPDGRPAANDEHGVPEEDRAMAAAVADVEGVRHAEAYLFLGEQASAGWPTEFGMAVAFDAVARSLGMPPRPIHVVAPWRGSVFWHLDNVFVHPAASFALAHFGPEALAAWTAMQGRQAVG
jgi:hypothetical protein